MPENFSCFLLWYIELNYMFITKMAVSNMELLPVLRNWDVPQRENNKAYTQL
jgi:hypothetical protein